MKSSKQRSLGLINPDSTRSIADPQEDEPQPQPAKESQLVASQPIDPLTDDTSEADGGNVDATNPPGTPVAFNGPAENRNAAEKIAVVIRSRVITFLSLWMQSVASVRFPNA